MKRLFICGALAGLIGCSPQHHSQNTITIPGLQETGLAPLFTRAPRTLSVVSHSGQALSGAKILIGMMVGSPARNWVVTDSNGQFTAPAGWTSALPITIEAEGHVRTTFYGQIPAGQTFALRNSVQLKDIEVKGQTTQFGTLPNDGFAHFGVVIPLLQKNELMTFNPMQLLSPQVDILDVYGNRVALPSNLTLPNQKQNYGIFPVTLNKPQYRWYVDKEGPLSLAAIRGKFPFKKVIDAMRGGAKITDVFNDFQFTGAGIRDMELLASGGYQDIPVNEIQVNTPLTITAPALGTGESIAAAALSSRGDQYYPSDVKILKSGQQLTVKIRPQDNSPIVVTVLAKDLGTSATKAFSATVFLSPWTHALAPQFFNLVPAPQWDGRKLQISRPTQTPELLAQATFASLQEITPYSNELGTFERVKPKWDVVASEWTDTMEIPTWPEDTLGKVNRWDVSMMGAGKDVQPPSGLSMTHVTRNAVDF